MESSPLQPNPLDVCAEDKALLRERLPLLLSQHEQLEELFLTHQEALLERDLDRAVDQLKLYQELLREHIREEEQTLLPIYAALGPAPRGASADLIHSEHEKILSRLGQLDEILSQLIQREEFQPRDLIETFDRQSSFKHLMEHHDLRERQYFFPALEEWCQ
jgi:hemerythrin-like domain-containing protein